jgi:hypothetical protein
MMGAALLRSAAAPPLPVFFPKEKIALLPSSAEGKKRPITLQISPQNKKS